MNNPINKIPKTTIKYCKLFLCRDLKKLNFIIKIKKPILKNIKIKANSKPHGMIKLTPKNKHPKQISVKKYCGEIGFIFLQPHFPFWSSQENTGINCQNFNC